MANPKVAKPGDDAPTRWPYTRVSAARELLDLIAAELAHEYIQLMEKDGVENPALTDAAQSKETK